MRNNAYLNDQREEVAGPSAKPSTMYEQLEKPIGPKKGGSSHAAAKKPKETFHGSDVNATHFPSRVGQLQKGLQQDIHPARQNDGGQCIPTTKGNRAAVFFVDERQYFVRLPHNKIKRFPSATTITPAYIESLEENSGSLYRGGSCNHSTCHLPDHMIGWSQYLGDYSVCPRRFDPELHKVLNPRSINRLAFEAYEHFQAAHRNEEAVLFYDFPTTRRSSVDMVEMPTSLVIFVERLTAFEVQQILIGKLDIDWSGAQGWYLLPRNVFIPKYDLWTDKYVAAPCRVSGYDAFGKFPLEDPGEFLDRLTDSAYNAFLQGQVTAARCPEGWCLVSVPWAARHRYGLVSVMDMSNEELTGAADGTKESALSTKGKNKHRALEGEKAIVTSFIDAHVPYLWLEEDISHLPAFKTSTQVPATTNSLDDRKPQAADLPSLTIKPTRILHSHCLPLIPHPFSWMVSLLMFLGQQIATRLDPIEKAWEGNQREVPKSHQKACHHWEASTTARRMTMSIVVTVGGRPQISVRPVQPRIRHRPLHVTQRLRSTQRPRVA
ncbi:hypothetical protein PMIN02_006113 [Paraphaeosphaeria minitans]